MLKTFLAFYLAECVLTQWCPDNYHFANNSATISCPSPQGSSLYPDNVRCEWRITIPDNFQHVMLSFSAFDLENCPSCSCDYVEVFDVVGANNISLGKFCGSVVPGPFFSSEQTLSVVFKSDYGNGFEGFKASYSSVLPGSVCRNATQIVASTGQLTSPEFSSRQPYPNNMNCVWQITTPPKTRIRFKVHDMSIQNCGENGTTDTCLCDFLEIRDGNLSSDHLLATLCGAEHPRELYSSGRYLWLRFKSDATVAGSGFLARFSSTTVIEGSSCPESWKYPIKCPHELNLNINKTGACCYDNGPNCCKPGGRRCTDEGESERDYCPRPNDDEKLKYCCIQKGEPSCCASSAVRFNFSIIVLVGVVAHSCYHGTT